MSQSLNLLTSLILNYQTYLHIDVSSTASEFVFVQVVMFPYLGDRITMVKADLPTSAPKGQIQDLIQVCKVSHFLDHQSANTNTDYL